MENNEGKTLLNESLLKKFPINFLFRVYTTFFVQSPHLIQLEIGKYEKILDLGCSIGKTAKELDFSYYVGVDIFKPYLQNAKSNLGDVELVLADISSLEFKKKSFDVILMISVLEHLTKEDGLRILEKLSEWARKKMILMVPNGFSPQEEYDGNKWQIHKSEWRARDFLREGFQVHGLGGFKNLRCYRGQLKNRPFFFFQILSDLSQKISYFFPEFGYELLCIKILKQDQQEELDNN